MLEERRVSGGGFLLPQGQWDHLTAPREEVEGAGTIAGKPEEPLDGNESGGERGVVAGIVD